MHEPDPIESMARAVKRIERAEQEFSKAIARSKRVGKHPTGATKPASGRTKAQRKAQRAARRRNR